MTSSRSLLARFTRRLGGSISKWKSAIPKVAVICVVLVLVGTAVIIARGDAAEHVAEEAQVLAWSESVVSAAAIVNAEVREGLMIGQGAELGVYDQEAVIDAAEHVEAAIDEMARRLGVLDQLTDADHIMASAATAEVLASEVAGLLVAGETDAAIAIASDDLAPSLEEVATGAAELRQTTADRIAATTQGLGTITTAARYVSALLIPVLVVFFIYRALRKNQKVSLLRSQLSRERELRHKKDAFLAAASHHIKTPLSAVVGFAELLRDRSRDFSAGVRNEITELLSIEAEETSNVVDDLLAAATYDLGKLELAEDEVEVREVVDSATSDWASKQRMRLTIKGDAVIQGDARWLSHVLRNLLRNAVSFGGEQINVNIRHVINKVVIAVSDNGQPIPDTQRDRIFELYYSYHQVDGLAPSLGLGLSVARRLTKAMGGDLDYDRRDGENVFQLTLPGAGRITTGPQLVTRTIDPNEGRPTSDSISQLIADGGPEIVYQPIVSLDAQSANDQWVVGYEALARFGSLSPESWLRAASVAGLQLELELSCITAAVEGFHPPEDEAFLAVNLGDRTLHSSLLSDAIAKIDPRRLVLELSESALINSYEMTKGVVDSLAARGVLMAVDDVGSGEVDLWHMARLDARIIKIDKSLVRGLSGMPRNGALIRAVTAMAEELGARVVAEGVETEDEHRALIDRGVGLGQGNLYSEPVRLVARDRAVGAG